MKYDIHHRWTGNVIVTAEIDCDESASASVKLGLAVRWAVKVRAYLADADLARAYLAGANLAGADLAGANLTRAYLAGANLTRANLADANLTRADLARAYLAGANLTRANLARANLADAYLARANLADACLADACLWGTSGNMVEVRSMQVDLWAVTWTTSFDGEVIVQIGCQRHPLRLWEKSDPRWIAAMDGRATEWWAKWREPLLAIVKANPAVPFGQAVRPKERGETPEEVGQ